MRLISRLATWSKVVIDGLGLKVLSWTKDFRSISAVYTKCVICLEWWRPFRK